MKLFTVGFTKKTAEQFWQSVLGQVTEEALDHIEPGALDGVK